MATEEIRFLRQNYRKTKAPPASFVIGPSEIPTKRRDRKKYFLLKHLSRPESEMLEFDSRSRPAQLFAIRTTALNFSLAQLFQIPSGNGHSISKSKKPFSPFFPDLKCGIPEKKVI